MKDKRHRLAWLDLRISPYLFVLPFFVLFGVFGLYPMARTAWMSLHHWRLLGEHTFVGLDNYEALLRDPYFWNAVRNTFAIFFIATVPQLMLALYLATLLNKPVRARTFFRMAILVPNVTSVAAVAIVFGMLFQRDFGVVNWVLGFVGIDPIAWSRNELPSWTALATMVDWRWTGYNALIFLAGMQAIPRELYESAAMDGAGPWRQFRAVTLPMLRPTLIFATIISTIGGLQLFTEPFIFNNGVSLGGAQREFQTIVLYLYERGIENLDTAGYGAAIAWMLFLMIVVMSVANYLLIRRTVRQ